MNLHRSRTNKMVAGVIGGLAQSLGLRNANLLRAGVAILSITPFGFPFFPIAYLLLWAILRQK